MDYEHDIKIKPEIEEIVEDKNDNYLQFYFDVDVKVENDTIIENDWCIQNVLSSHEYHETMSYEDLKQEKLQTCMMCGVCFYDSFSLLKHNLIHLEVPLIRRKLFMCEDCPKFYKNKSELQNHIVKTHLANLNNRLSSITRRHHKCTFCKKKYSYQSLFGHVREVHGENVKCMMCKSTFKCQRYLSRHIRFVHEREKPNWHYSFKVEMKCSLCPSILDSRSALTTHMRNCHSKERFTCHLCKSTLKCKSYLFAHMRRVHYNDGLLHKCNICAKDFRSPRYLRIHIKNSHSKPKK